MSCAARVLSLGSSTSTLCFPTALARRVRWGGVADDPHDEPSWLIRAQRTVSDLRVIQLPETLSVYNIAGPSVSRDSSDRTDTYIQWGLHYLGKESPRVLGDYLCTSAVSAAVSARSLKGEMSRHDDDRLGVFGTNFALSVRN